jgi:hypothetical protein
LEVSKLGRKNGAENAGTIIIGRWEVIHVV